MKKNKLTPKQKKAFGLSRILIAILNASNNGDPKLSALSQQVYKLNAMFHANLPLAYFKISEEMEKLWIEISKEHNNTLTDDEVSLFTELICSLIPKKDFKEIFKIAPHTTKEKICDSKKSALLMTILDIDKKMNTLFSTSANASRETLGALIVKPVITKRVKKKRDTAKPKRLKKLKNMIKYAKRKQEKQEKQDALLEA